MVIKIIVLILIWKALLIFHLSFHLYTNFHLIFLLTLIQNKIFLVLFYTNKQYVIEWIKYQNMKLIHKNIIHNIFN